MIARYRFLSSGITQFRNGDMNIFSDKLIQVFCHGSFEVSRAPCANECDNGD